MTRVLAIILLLLAFAPAQAQDQGAKGFVERLLESMLSAEGRSLSIQNTSISFTGDVTVGRVEVKDGDDAWLVIENLSLVWRPLSLFGKQLEVTSLTAENVHMLRMPRTPEGSVAAPQEIQDLTAAVIKQLEISRLKLDQPVLGQEAELKLVGSGEITVEPVQILADMTASRLDGKKGDLRLKVALDPRTRNVQASVNFSEDADGILANLLNLRGEPSVDLQLDASGSYANWSSTFNLDLDKSRVFDGSARAVTDATGQTITVDGAGAMIELLPPSLEQTFAGTSRFSASINLPAGANTAMIDHVSLDNEAFRFNLSGLADWQGNSSNLVAELAAKNADALFDLPETGSLGVASIAGLKGALSVTGSLQSPDWRVSLDWADLASDRLTLKPFSARLQGRGLIATAEAPVTFNGSLDGQVGQGRDNSLPPALTGPLSGSISGGWRADGQVGLTSATLEIGASSVEATGTVDPFGGSYDLDVKARTASPVTGTALLDKLLEGQVTASARIAGGGPNGFSIEDLNFSSPAVSVNSTGRIDGKSADLSLDIAFPDLGVLRNGVSGAAAFNAKLKGPWSSLDAALDGTGENVSLLEKTLDAPKILARFTFNDGRPQGDISVSATLAGRPIGINGSFVAEADGTTVLRDFVASSGSARATGELRWPSNGLPQGRITFEAPDLKDVGPLVLIDLSGAMTGSIEMSGSGDAHQTAITFSGSNVASADFAAGKAQGSVMIANIFDRPQPSGSATFGNLRIGNQRFDTAVITAEPNGADGYRATATVKGRDLSADAEADVTFADGATTHSLSRLSGKLRGTAFKAAAPFTVRQTKDGVSIGSATLNVGKGTIKLGGTVSPRLDVTASVKALPLSAFESLGGVPGLRGTLAGEAAITGTIDAPQGRYKLSASGLTTSSLESLKIRPITGTANGAIAGRAITVTLKANAGPDLTITGDGKVDGGRSTIDMSIKGRAGSRLFSDRLASSGVRAQGNLSFDLRINGPLAKPSINGEIALASGTLGDTAGQFTVRDVQGRAEIRGSTLRIVSLSGKTGRKGTASASGTISLDSNLNSDLRVTIKDGVYTDGSFVTSRYKADLVVRGPLRGGPVLTGEVGLRDTKITLSELPRRAVKPDDVKHIRAPAPVRRQARELERFTQGGGSNLEVDLVLRALDPISVSGRGLNVVLTGDLRVVGPLNNLSPRGSFEMLRGRLALPARNLDFERGSLTFDRDFDPLINFVAVSRRSDATITLAVTGHASEPSIKVTSVPQMPEEEALARLIFNSSMLELSPIQIAQIASYVATVTGGGGGGILSGLQAAMGLDFTVGTSEKGETQIGVAKQLNDRLSVGIEQTTKSNTTRVNIDLSATPNVKLRGSIDSDSSSRIGVYYEKDY